MNGNARLLAVLLEIDRDGAEAVHQRVATIVTPTQITVSRSLRPVKVNCSKAGYQDGWDFLVPELSGQRPRGIWQSRALHATVVAFQCNKRDVFGRALE